MLKRLIFIILTISTIIPLTGCTKTKESNDTTSQKILGSIYSVETDKNGDISIPKDTITDVISNYIYEYEGISLGLIAIKDENNHTHILINTCASCGGSPNAYFMQIGNTIQCQNCGNTFAITDLDNLMDDGCNPIGIKSISEQVSNYIISHEEIEQYKEKFINWEGPKIDNNNLIK